MPAPTSSSSKSVNPSGSRRARRVSGGVQIGVLDPETAANTAVPPGAVTRANSSKNGIMFRRTHEVERAVLERKLRGVGDVEPDVPGQLGRQQGSGLFDHRGRQVDPHDVGPGKPLGGEAGSLARPGAEIEDPARLDLDAVESDNQRRKPLRPDHLVPAGREPVELRSQRTTEDPPQPGPGDDDAGHEARETAPDRLAAAVHQSTAEIFSSSPALTPNICAAFPRLIASEMFQ